MKRLALIATLALIALPVFAQQAPQPEPKTLTEAKLVIVQQQAQISELSLRVSELEAAFTSQLTQARQQEVAKVQAAQTAVHEEQQTLAQEEAAAAKKAADAKTAAKKDATPQKP